MAILLADQSLMRSARLGDGPVFAELVDRHYRALLASCRRMLGDLEMARNAAQEAVLRALLGLDHLRDDTRFGAWLVGIGLNVCRGLLGARSLQASSLEGALLDSYKEYIDMTDETAQLVPIHVAELRRTAATDPDPERHMSSWRTTGTGDFRSGSGLRKPLRWRSSSMTSSCRDPASISSRPRSWPGPVVACARSG